MLLGSSALIRSLSADSIVAQQVARWTLDDAGGLVDTIGGLTLTPSGTVTSAAGIIGTSRSFYGSGSLSTPISLTRTGLAIEVWVRRRVFGYWQGIFSIGNQGNVELFLNDYTVQFDWTPAAYHVSTPIPNILNTWTHFVLVRHSDTTARLYMNGVQVSQSGPGASGANIGSPLCIGSLWNTYYFNGDIDETAIYQFRDGDPESSYWLWRYNSGAGRRP